MRRQVAAFVDVLFPLSFLMSLVFVAAPVAARAYP